MSEVKPKAIDIPNHGSGPGVTMLKFQDGRSLVMWFKNGGDEYCRGRKVEVNWQHRPYCGQKLDKGQECSCRPRALLTIE